MVIKKCKCGATLKTGERHQCPHHDREVSYEDDASFFISAAVAALSDSAILGTAVGGSVTGGIIGDILDGDLFD